MSERHHIVTKLETLFAQLSEIGIAFNGKSMVK